MSSIASPSERVELLVAHPVAQILEQGAAEAGDHAAILGELGAGLGPRVAARQRDDAQHARMIDQRIEQAGLRPAG